MDCETNCKEQSSQFVMLCLDELFELAGHGVDVGVVVEVLAGDAEAAT